MGSGEPALKDRPNRRAMKKKGDKRTRKNLNIRAVLVAVFLLGAAAGFLIDRYISAADREQSAGSELRAGGYDFISPLLECEMPQNTILGSSLRSFRSKITDIIETKKKEHGASHVSVYYRDLNNGPWIGIDEKQMFSPSSLLKVPLMIAVLKDAETNPGILNKTITYAGNANLNLFENIKPSDVIKQGKSYTVEQLINYMIVYSDNNAYLLLLKNYPKDKLIKVYTELGVDVPYESKQEDFMSVKEYASFFRILFNASYLNKDMSVRALKYLSQVYYRNGIVAGVPPYIGVVHKFGERSMGARDEIKQLHDCGIVYYPKHPYLLCVMTRGESFSALEGVIKDISKLTYNELDNLYREKP